MCVIRNGGNMQLTPREIEKLMVY
ncbi:urease subunit gamma, partial [Klebsiella pneumoniae]|nr:urease subunit gamma [Klebsiella pneumoniae]